MEQTLIWLKTWTAALVLIALFTAFVVGVVLRALVRKASIHPSHALRVIESISVVVGGAVGSVVVLLLLIILWPVAGNWVINTFRHVDMADGVSAVDHRKDTGSNNFICDWSSDPTCPIRQRVPWHPERMEHEMASRKIDGKTIRYVRTPTRELGAAAVGAIGAVERLRHLGHAEPARRRLAAAEILGAVGGSLPTCTHKKSIGPLP